MYLVNKIVNNIINLKSQSIITLVGFNKDFENIKAYDVTAEGKIGYNMFHELRFKTDIKELIDSGDGVLSVRVFTEEKINGIPIKNISMYQITKEQPFIPLHISTMIQAHSIDSKTEKLIPICPTENFVYDILSIKDK